MHVPRTPHTDALSTRTSAQCGCRTILAPDEAGMRANCVVYNDYVFGFKDTGRMIEASSASS